jgi:hypothetical protein
MMRALLAAVLGAAALAIAQARDLGQWDDVGHSAEVRAFFRSLVQPHTVGYGGIPVSCCGEVDAYYADRTAVRAGKSFAVITDERDDEPLGRVHVPIGTEYEIPPDKIVGPEQTTKGNPTGHVIIFLGTIYSGDVRTRPVLCYVQNWGT